MATLAVLGTPAAGMTEPLELHLHIPADLTGVVHIHLGSSSNGQPAPAPAPSPAESEPSTAADDDRVAEMLARFERHDPTSAARRVYEALVDGGWEARLPQPRGGKPASAAAYIRMVYEGSKHKVTLYLNSAALMSAGRREREFATSLPGAQPQTEQDVYFPHGGGAADQAIENAEALRRWADGSLDRTES